MSKCTALFVNLQYLKEEEEEERMVDENLEVSEEGERRETTQRGAKA